jgi:carboxymethylenebutenolidase
MKEFTPEQQTMLATWQQHTYAEFALKDVDAALATMTENPYVLLIGSGVVRVGRAAVREFYANQFLPNIPPDLEVTTVSQTFGDDRIAEEMAVALPIRSIWIGFSRGYGPPAGKPN